MRFLPTEDDSGIGSMIGSIEDAIGGISDAINGVNTSLAYWSDPWGNTFNAFRDTASGLSTDVLPALTEATLPDLTTDWFRDAYAVSFAAAILAAVVLLIPQILRTARGAQAGRDLVHSLGTYFGLFLAGATFGPAIGAILVSFFHALSDDIVDWGLGATVDGVIGDFQTMISETDAVGMTGGVPIAVFLMLCMIVGLLLVFVMLIIQLVTLYFTGVLIPLSLVWIIDPNRRQFGMQLVVLWVGILAAHPVLFFLLAFAFTMMANSVDTFGNNLNLASLVQFSVAVIALFIAALSPLLLLKFAKVFPSGFGGTSGPAVATNSIGPQNMSDAVRRFDNSDGGRGGQRSAARSEQVSEVASKPGTLAEASAAKSLGGKAAEGGSVAASASKAAAEGAAKNAPKNGGSIGAGALVAAGVVTAGAKTVRLTQAAATKATDATDS